MHKIGVKIIKKTGIIVTFILLLIIFLIISSYLFKRNSKIKDILNNSNIYNNIYINDFNISNFSKEDAIKFLAENAVLNEKITLYYGQQKFEYNKIDLGFGYDFKKSVDEAYSIGRQGDDQERYEEVISLYSEPRSIDLYYTLDESILYEVISKLEAELNQPVINATLIKNGNNFEIVNGETGLVLNKERIINDIKETLDETGDIFLEIHLDEVQPANAEDLKMVKDVIGSYKTTFANNGTSDSARVTNLTVAAKKINGTILYPGEVFSTNEKFGPTTKENGYAPAGTIINGKIQDEYGGGVCQVSSTLYNAVLYAELDVVERQNHSLKVGYVDYGYDATLAGDYIDFKFKNSKNYPIYIESYLTDNEVICNIYGFEDRPSNREIRFQNTLVETIAPGPRVETETDELLLGEEKVEVTALTGYKYKLYKLIYIDGTLNEKVLVNNSYYRPRAQQVLIGTNIKGIDSVNNNLDESFLENIKIEDNLIIETNSTEPVTENFESNDFIEVLEELVTEIEVFTECSILEELVENIENNILEELVENIENNILE